MADNEEYSDGVAEGEDFSDDGEDFSGDEASSDNGADDADEFEYQGKGGGLAFDVGVGCMPVLVSINGVNQGNPFALFKPSEKTRYGVLFCVPSFAMVAVVTFCMYLYHADLVYSEST
jgi:hypothetical protein